MSWSENFVNYAEKFWQIRRNKLGEFSKTADNLLSSCAADEALLLKFFLATLPLSDLGAYSPHLLLRFAKNALQARREFSWCAALPENIFLLHVAYPRINTEELADCRDIFHNALANRIRNLPLESAILEVNRWCAEEATYRSTDLRTASPLAVYTCGFGRCGEESTFAVTALRSVGIAARQVYAPWWSHCDDNHAWVEVFDGTRWRYLGACEPEPTLDRGWFTSAASRAMMIHARAFVQGEKADFAFLFPHTSAENLSLQHGVVLEAVTQNYASTRLLTLRAVDELGHPVAGAVVNFSVLNMAQLAPIATRITDKNGTAEINLGLGTVHVSVYSSAGSAEAVINVADTDALTLVLGSLSLPDEDIDFSAPMGASGYPQPLTAEQKSTRRAWLDYAAAQREKKHAPVNANLSAEEQLVCSALTEKDRAVEVPQSVFEDTRAAFVYKNLHSIEIFRDFLLSPRIGIEPLAPWRDQLAAAFSPVQREEFSRDPRKILDWLDKNVALDDSYPELCGTPAGNFRLKSANAAGRNVLFCALCRAFGVPARLSALTSQPEFYSSGKFRSISETSQAAVLTLRAPADRPAQFAKNYSLARMENGSFVTLTTRDIAPGKALSVELQPGTYRIFTVNRLPNGNQLAHSETLRVTAGASLLTELSFRDATPAEMLECQALPPFSLRDSFGNEHSAADILACSDNSLFFWLEVGREPTEHILNELRESAEAFKSAGCPLNFVLETPAQEQDPTLKKTLSALTVSKAPLFRVWFGDFTDTVTTLARRMFGDPDKLPLVILTDSKANGLYSCSGYNVGTAELLIKLLSAASE